MLNVLLFLLAIIFSLCQLICKKEGRADKVVETLLAYILLFNVGIMSLLAAYAHLFMGPETAASIGWKAGSPFQLEIGMANLSYGVIGVIAFWLRDRFWDATIIGWSVFLLGCFVVHVIDYFAYNNTAPYNIGPYIWFYDLFLPIVVLGLYTYWRKSRTA